MNQQPTEPVNSEPKFKINDLVWIASHGTKEVRKDCPVCFGNLKVTLILGDDSRCVLDCDYCGKGFEGPRGYVTEHEWIAEPRCVTISGLEIQESSKGKVIQYNALNSYSHDTADVFATKEEAHERCLVKIAEHEAEEAKLMEFRKQNNKKNYSWHVGYHHRAAKEAARQLAYHEKKAVFMKARIRNTP